MPKDNEQYNRIYTHLSMTRMDLTTAQRRKRTKQLLAKERKEIREGRLIELGPVEEGNLERLAHLPDHDTRDKEGV